MDAIKVIFKEADDDGSMTLNLEEWKNCAKKLALKKGQEWNKAAEAAAEKEFGIIDQTNNKSISLAELDLHIVNLQLEAVRVRFKKADTSKDRKLDNKEFHAFFKDEGMKKRARDKLWKKCDKNGDGKVSYTEFSDWMEREMADGVLKDTFGDMFEADEKERKAKAEKLAKEK